MKTAFIVLKSPQEQDPARAIAALAERGDATVILVEDGVLQALAKAPGERLSKACSEVLVSREDVEAKGFSERDLTVGKVVGYPEIVECIMERTGRTITV
jgi:sulfur relay protein TusB/DsrH